MSVWLWWIIAALPPGRYVGTSSEGQIGLELRADGTADFGGAPYRWNATKRSLELVGKGQSYLFDVKETGVGALLTGSRLGPIYLKSEQRTPPRPVPEPAPRVTNPAWVGRWQHQAIGGQVTLSLEASGAYRLTQSQPGQVAQSTNGTWWSESGAMLLSSKDVVLRYTVSRIQGTLEIAGGDLPFAVPFALLAEEPDPPVYSGDSDPGRQQK